MKQIPREEMRRGLLEATMGAGSIVIKHEQLALPLRRQVRDILDERKMRMDTARGWGLVTTAGASGFLTGLHLTIGPERMPRGLLLALLGSTLVPALATGPVFYKYGSRKVRPETEGLSKFFTTGFLDEDNKVNVEQIRDTHPFAFVNRRGDLVLVPATKVQRAIYKAQRTFFKHILPGRYRVKV